MLLTRIILKNWKNFQDIDISFRERAFIVVLLLGGKIWHCCGPQKKRGRNYSGRHFRSKQSNIIRTL